MVTDGWENDVWPCMVIRRVQYEPSLADQPAHSGMREAKEEEQQQIRHKRQ